jgi:hypothetical protein
MMSENKRRPSAKELEELSAYLESMESAQRPAPGEAGFPTGLAGELINLAENTQPDPAFASKLEDDLRKVMASPKRASLNGWLTALWQSFTPSERNLAMKRLLAISLVAVLLLIILWVSLPLVFPSPTQTQVAIVPQASQTPLATPLSPLTPTVVPPTSQPPVAINFTPQPLPQQPPSLLPLADALGLGYGGSGSGNLPQRLPLTLETELPASPAQVGAYYRLENSPLTLDAARQIASQWGMAAHFYTPAWMQSVTPDQLERSYIAVDGMQVLSMWNGELSFNNISIFPVYEGHQYPQTALPPSDQAIATATQYLLDRGYLDFPYQVDLSQYNYGLVNFFHLLDDLLITYHAASVKIDSLGEVGSVWVSREDYTSVGMYPIISAEEAWNILIDNEPTDQRSISYYPAGDGNPKYWGRVYPSGQVVQVFGAPTYLSPADGSSTPYVQLNNLVLSGNISGLLEYLQSDHGYIHAWGIVQEVDGTRQLELAGWEPFDEFSGYFNGTVHRSAEGDFLELEYGRELSLPDLPADVPADIPLYVQGGLVGDALEWFILQVHPADEGQQPPDLSQAEVVIEKVELIYLNPQLSNLSPGMALDPAYRMLVPAWCFSGRVTNTSGADLLYKAYVQAVLNP